MRKALPNIQHFYKTYISQQNFSHLDENYLEAKTSLYCIKPLKYNDKFYTQALTNRPVVIRKKQSFAIFLQSEKNLPSSKDFYKTLYQKCSPDSSISQKCFLRLNISCFLAKYLIYFTHKYMKGLILYEEI